jgi:hypothetical protein
MVISLLIIGQPSLATSTIHSFALLQDHRPVKLDSETLLNPPFIIFRPFKQFGEIVQYLGYAKVSRPLQ